MAYDLLYFSTLVKKAPYFKWKFLFSINGSFFIIKFRLNGTKLTHIATLKPAETIVDLVPFRAAESLARR